MWRGFSCLLVAVASAPLSHLGWRAWEASKQAEKRCEGNNLAAIRVGCCAGCESDWTKTTMDDDAVEGILEGWLVKPLLCAVSANGAK